MSVKANQSDGVIDVALSDTTILQPTGVRFAVTAAFLTNTASAARSIIVYESPDLTSASGREVAFITLDAEEGLPIEEVIGQSYRIGSNLIAVAQDGSSGDVKARLTFTSYSGDS